MAKAKKALQKTGNDPRDKIPFFAHDEVWAAITAIVTISIIYIAGRDFKNKATPKDMQIMQNQISSVLKDPATTERLVEQFKDTVETHKLLADPQIKQNLQKIVDAAEASLEQREAPNDIHPTNWTEKAVQGKGGQSPRRD